MTITEQRLRQAADRAMTYAARASNLAIALNALAQRGLISDDKFWSVTGMHPDTMSRMKEIAKEDYNHAKEAYECVCLDLGVPSAVTYNED